MLPSLNLNVYQPLVLPLSGLEKGKGVEWKRKYGREECAGLEREEGLELKESALH